jgi:hypothetical protein
MMHGELVGRNGGLFEDAYYSANPLQAEKNYPVLQSTYTWCGKETGD